MYRVHCITIRNEDREKAEPIVAKYFGFKIVDDVSVSSEIRKDSNGNNFKQITYWIKAYCYEDFEAIRDEFIENGIRII